MMQKKFWMIPILILFLIGIYVNPLKEKSLTDKLYPQRPIHVFFEAMATQPAFNGMIEMVQLPKDDPKIFVWHRFPNRAKLVDLKEINAIELDITPGEGQLYEAKHKLLQALELLLEKYPQSPLIIYTNMNNYVYLFDGLLQNFPNNRIKHVHLYEDGLGELFSRVSYFNSISFTKQAIADLKNYYYGNDENRKLPEYARYMMHYIMPVTYHFYGYSTAVKNKLLSDNFLNLMKEATFKDIDFEKVAKKLSSEEKNLLYRLVDFDYEKYKKLSKENKIFLFFGGYYLGMGVHLYHAETNYLSYLTKKYPDYYFLLKPHPSYESLNRDRFLEQAFKGVPIEMVNPKIPYEIFIIAGLLPDKISGHCSSSFYTLTDEILDSYIPYSVYEKGVNLMQGIDFSKAVDLSKFVPKEPYFFDEKIKKNGKAEYLLMDKNDHVFLYNERHSFKKENKNGKDIFCFQENCFIPYQKDGLTHWGVYEDIYIEHPEWKDELIYQSENRYCRKNKKDCGVVQKRGIELEICWEKSSCEFFIKQKEGQYTYRKVNINKTLEKEFVVQHNHWQDKLILDANDRYCREQESDCGFVKEMTNGIEICWEYWPCETFKKEDSGIYKK